MPPINISKNFKNQKNAWGMNYKIWDTNYHEILTFIYILILFVEICCFILVHGLKKRLIAILNAPPVGGLWREWARFY